MAALALTTAMAATGLSPAAANTYGPNGSGLYYPDGVNHEFHYIDLSAATNSSMNWARVDALGNDTDMNQYIYAVNNLSMDVIARDNSYPDSWLGSVVCVRVHSGGQLCDSWELFINERLFVGRSQNERTKTAVHEVGHTVGLGHSTESTSPMIQGYSTNIRYNTHDKGHINNRF